MIGAGSGYNLKVKFFVNCVKHLGSTIRVLINELGK